jgi:exosortase
VSAVGAGMAFALVYWNVLAKLVHDWLIDDNYSHGIFIVPLALYFAWRRRAELVAAPRRPSVTGLIVIAASLAILIAGMLGAELFLTRIAMLGTVAGIVLFVWGRVHLRILSFPLSFLLLMIPIPAILFNQITGPLQLLASRMGEQTLTSLHVPVLREGNIIVLPNTSLAVEEACSGIRSLVSLLTLGIVYGYFADRRAGIRVALAAATVPIAIVANGLRVAGTGLLAQIFGAPAAEGFFHTFSGWLVFVSAFVLLVGLHLALSRVASIDRDVAPAVRLTQEAGSWLRG